MTVLWSRMRRWHVLIGVALLITLLGCCLRSLRPGRADAPRRPPNRVLTLEATGYCACGKCCNWRRNWLFRPVVASGPDKGRPKKVGITASGTRARKGTIAADTSMFPFGTVMEVTGYGYGRVEDRGGAIKGRRIDLYFRTHRRALEWGRQTVRVKVWYPRQAGR